MKIVFRIVGLLALGVLGWFAWIILFPSPETVIRKRLTKVATLLTFNSKEGTVARAANVLQLTGHFATEVEIVVDTPSQSRQTVTGRDELQQAALVARTTLPGLEVEFIDPQVSVAADKTNATVNVTGKIKVPGDRDFFIQEMKILLRKKDGEWLIIRVETVRTLT